MKLVRLVHFEFGKSPNAWLQTLVFNIDGVKLWKLAQDEESAGKKMMIAAETSISNPPIVDGVVHAPKVAREKCEEVIEYVANLIAVQANTTRKITSLHPCVVLHLENDADRQYVAGCKGMLVGGKTQSYRPYVGPDDLSKLVALYDRKEGFALLAEALNHNSSSGKYKDLIRLFENAFRMKHSKLAGRLVGFLDNRMNYTRSEVSMWLSLRNGSNHGERSKNPKLFFEADVKQFLPRMEQAAYDILFNKAKWHHDDILRNDIWRPSAYMAGRKPLQMSAEAGAQIDGIIMTADAYDVYGQGPMLVKDDFPEPWWPCPAVARGEESSFEGYSIDLELI
jgi:hypothetical protein